MIWLILTVALLAWPVWAAWRWELVRRVYTSQEPPAQTITPKHVQALRKLRFAWNTAIESGGPVVDPLTPYGSENLAADLGPILGTRDKVAIASFTSRGFLASDDLGAQEWKRHPSRAASHPRAQRRQSACTAALSGKKLAEVDYRLSHLDNASMQGQLRRELARYPGLPSEQVEAILAEVPRLNLDGQFRFTDQHRRLLRELRLEWPDRQIISLFASSGYPAPAVHFKRPFGDMTSFEIDMAAILGLHAQDDTIDPLLENRLYWEMWPALQTFVEHAQIDRAARPPDGN